MILSYFNKNRSERVAMLNMRFVFLVMMLGFSNRGLSGAKLVYFMAAFNPSKLEVNLFASVHNKCHGLCPP